ncbi:MAG: potassium channel protein [Patescibacteria group bacterium]|nr:potassium channel protein [Patescibacteria group bacterium]
MGKNIPQINDESSKGTNFWGLVLMIVALAGIGTLGYMFIEGWSFLDALYMVVITLATVGFKEVHTMSPAGTIFTILLIVFGIVTLYYVLRMLSEYVLENKLEERFKSKRMDKTIQNLSGHIIVCGFGRVGTQVVSELDKDTTPFVVVEQDEALVEKCEAGGHMCVKGDATSEDTLKRAGVMNARGIVICLGRDSDTIMAIITAKAMNSSIFVVARANQGAAASKLSQVGADRVVSPHQIGGFRMASFALSPEVADFIDDIQDLGNSEIQIDDVIVPQSSPVAGHTIAQKLSNKVYGATVLAINKPDGKAIINPIGDTLVEAGDRLILIGTKEKLTEVLKLLGAQN